MISIVLCTAREEPRFSEFCDSLAISLERCSHPAELLVIDRLLWEDDRVAARRAKLDAAVRGRFSYRHIPPKPNAWQGKFRKTNRDYSDHNGARNTGIALARGAYIVFVDDCCLVDPDWYTFHYRAAVTGTAVAGSFKSYDSAVIENGQIVSGVLSPGQDHRVEIHPVPLMLGGWFYGLASGAPLKWLLAVNGYDEIFAGQPGGDDLCLGIRIERAGCKINFMADCLVYQVMETHTSIYDNPASGYPKGPPSKQKELQLRSGRIAFCNEMLIQNLLDDSKRIDTVGNDFRLKELRARALLTGEFPTKRAVERHWVDNQLLSEM